MMADWQTVRYDPTYPEPLDQEIIPLCDALNAAGFVTTSSCCGHGTDWPYVVFEHSTDERIERLARFVQAAEDGDAARGDYRPFFTVWQKEVLREGYRWSVAVHLNEVYGDTPVPDALRAAKHAIGEVTKRVRGFAEVLR